MAPGPATVACPSSPLLWRVQAPPPPPPTPYVPPTGYAGGPPSVPPQGPRRGFPWLWVLLGCGCLLIILIAGAVAGGFFYFSHRTEGPQPVLQEETTKPIPEERATTSESATDEEKSGGESESEAKADDSGAEEATPAAEQPSREKAVAKALSRCDKGWVTKVMKHSDDWTTATIAVGPPASEWVAEFDLKWNGSDYDIVAERGE